MVVRVGLAPGQQQRDCNGVCPSVQHGVAAIAAVCMYRCRCLEGKGCVDALADVGS